MAKVLRLVKLRLRNFQGAAQFELIAEGGNVSVYGDNATGKTTLCSAWNWLLFDKDSLGRKDFDIKTQDATGQPVHNLEHEVEGALELDGAQIALRKVYQEKWTKKRGSATAEFGGHTTDHFIDGVPVTQAEYKTRIAQLGDENLFRLLTDPRFFNEQLHWQKRRDLLLSVCGDVTDSDVITGERSLADLPQVLGSRKLDDHLKVIKARRTEINRELEKIPVRIDEANRALPEAGGNRETIKAQIASLNEKRRALAAETAGIDNGTQTLELRKRIREIELEMLTVQRDARVETDRAVEREQAKLSAVSDQAESARRTIRRLQSELQEGEAELQRLYAQRETLIAEWHQINTRQFTLTQEESCPACGQALPHEHLDAAREKALAEFNTRKSTDLEANVSKGKATKQRIEETATANEQRRAELTQTQAVLAQLTKQAADIQARIDLARAETPDPARESGYQALQREKTRLEQEIAGLREGTSTTKERVAQQDRELAVEINSLQVDLARIEQRRQGLARSEELKAEEKKLAAEFEKLERELYLCEEFTRAKARMLEERINSRFTYAKFRLFNTQLNGGLEDCCECLYGGVAYSGSLNNGAKINAGLDVINTLSEHYGFEAPIWIDNSESVTRLIPTRAQVIRLVVSEQDKQLRVEREAV